MYTCYTDRLYWYEGIAMVWNEAIKYNYKLNKIYLVHGTTVHVFINNWFCIVINVYGGHLLITVSSDSEAVNGREEIELQKEKVLNQKRIMRKELRLIHSKPSKIIITIILFKYIHCNYNWGFKLTLFQQV